MAKIDEYAYFMPRINSLCYAIVVLTLISALVGIFYSTGGSQFSVENIYGETIMYSSFPWLCSPWSSCSLSYSRKTVYP